MVFKKSTKERTPKERVALKLARKNYSSWELRAHFKEEIPEIDEVLAYFTEQGYLNDEEWLASFIRQEQGRGQGPRAIEGKLRQKGVPYERIQQALSDASSHESSEETFREALQVALLKKTKGAPLTPETRRKLIAHLLRRGFAWEEINQALSSL